MSAPARRLRHAPLRRARASRAAASPWPCPPRIERMFSAQAPAMHFSTTTSRTLPRPSPPRKGATALQDSHLPQQPQPLPEVWFTAHRPLLSSDPNNKPPDPRKAKLGKTLRILQERLPTLLQSPLPQEVLSPRIRLHLFPSTHPHLPTVTGRVAYIAALWTSPIAWNRVPLVGNVRLEILSARMLDQPPGFPGAMRGETPEGGGEFSGSGRPNDAYGEQLVVRWRTVGGGSAAERMIAKGLLSFVGNGGKEKGRRGAEGGKALGGDGGREEDGGSSSSATEVKAPVGMAQPAGSSDKEFTGLFIFSFDGEGRILSHTIEHVQEGGQWEKGVGAKVVGLTDWLLGGIKGGDAPCPAFARRERL